MKRFLAAGAIAILALATATSARADYVGQTVSGTLAFGPNGAGGGQFWPSTSVVVPGSFTYSDTFNIDTAQFTGSTLTVSDQVLNFAGGWQMTFTDASMPFTLLSLASSDFSPSLTYSLSGGTITLDWTGTSTLGTYSAVFTISPVPEPDSLALLGSFLLGLGLLRRKRA